MNRGRKLNFFEVPNGFVTKECWLREWEEFGDLLICLYYFLIT